MKKFLKNNIKLILVFLLGIIISSGITAYAVNNYMSEQIRYQNNTFAINSVSEALDDLYSYSKEKIDNYTSNNYSTEEQVVGTWIDGKPIYQKTIYIESATINSYVDYDISTADLLDNENIVLIKLEGGYYADWGRSYQQYHEWGTSFAALDFNAQYGYVGHYRQPEKVIRIQGSWGNTSQTLRKLNFTLQYTKTTDTATS